MASRDDREPDAGERLADLLVCIHGRQRRLAVDHRLVCATRVRAGQEPLRGCGLGRGNHPIRLRDRRQHAGAGGYTEQGRFEPWLFRITMNRVRDEARRAKLRLASRSISNVAPILAVPVPTRGLGASILAKLRQGLGQVSDADREVIEVTPPRGPLLQRDDRDSERAARDASGEAPPGAKKLRNFLDAAGITSPVGDDDTIEDSTGGGNEA